MNQNIRISHLRKMLRRYQLVRGTEVLLWSTAGGVVIFFLARILMSSPTIPAILGFTMGVLAAFIVSQHLHLFTMSEQRLALYLNRIYPILRDSADLLLKNDETLSSLQQLQKKETLLRLQEIYPSIKLPHNAGRAALALMLSVASGFFFSSFLQLSDKVDRSSQINGNVAVKKDLLPAKIRASTITVSPPAYTKITPRSVSEFNLQIPEGSVVRWNITFEGHILDPCIIFSGRDTIEFVADAENYTIQRTLIESGFYQLIWKNPAGILYYSDYYKIDVDRDNPPSLQLQDMQQHLELSTSDDGRIQLNVSIADDYAVRESTIIATVSKGSGEAVKFREEKLNFDKPMISGKRIQASRLLDLHQLGLQPGDELYFYVEAFDNKLPHANRARTETYFITLQDTSSIASALEASLGVDLMPEYFRSQRQIIIDSEKLLKDKKHLARPTFNGKSNELAYDQKILRLRYGEFLGEEFESGIGPQNSNRGENETNDEAIEKKFGHDHDRGHESHQPEESVAKKSHSHDEAKSLTGAKLSPLEEFVHAHDGDEEATFFVQSIKAKLKAAITIMWDAELYLRLYQPEKSLPYQYKALKLLKEISHESRVYVHRTGFDPPPIKEDKRLTGDLSEISNSTSEQKAEEKQTFPAIRAALNAIEPLLDSDTIVISESTKKMLANAGQELARLELSQPGRYLNALSMLNRILQNQISVSNRRSTLLIVRSSMWKALPPQSVAPDASSETPHQLTLEFLRSLEKMQHND